MRALSWSPKKACACTDETRARAPAARCARRWRRSAPRGERLRLADVEGDVAAPQPLVVGRAARRGTPRTISSAQRRRGARRCSSRSAVAVPEAALDGDAPPSAAANGEGAVLGDGAASTRPGRGQHLGPAGRAARSPARRAAPRAARATSGVVGRGHQRAVVRERVVDVAEDAAQPRRQRRQLVDAASCGRTTGGTSTEAKKLKPGAGVGVISMVGVRS